MDRSGHHVRRTGPAATGPGVVKSVWKGAETTPPPRPPQLRVPWRQNEDASRAARSLWRKAGVGSNRIERQILDTIEKVGGLFVEYRSGKPGARLANGSPIPREGDFDFRQAVELGWLVPDPLSPSLLPETKVLAQRYLVSSDLVLG